MKFTSLFLIQLFIEREKIFSVVMIHQHNSDTGVIIKKIINMYVVEKKKTKNGISRNLQETPVIITHLQRLITENKMKLLLKNEVSETWREIS